MWGVFYCFYLILSAFYVIIGLSIIRRTKMSLKRYEIIVAGGGFAGAAAAISAARMGKKVLLIEKYNCMGGAAVFDLVNPFMRSSTTDPDDGSRVELSRGIYLEIVDRMRELGGMGPKTWSMMFNEETLKYVLNCMALESGVELLYQTYITGVRKDGERIKSVYISNISGNSEIEADCFIDATGDANITAMAGCPYRLGRESDNLCQPMTLCFRLAGVKNYNADVKSRINTLYRQYQGEGKIKNPREDVLIFRTLVDDILHFNTTRVVKLDPTNAEDVTRAEIIAREQVIEMYDFLRENFEEFKDSTLISTGIQIGVRESRMIQGEYTLTKEDLLAFKSFDDSIAVCNYDIDIHSPDGAGTSHYYFPSGRYYGIPYRCLIPKNAENLLAAGRCISGTHDAQASFRIMPTCTAIGEAAGIAAALALDSKGVVRAVDVNKLRDILSEKGAKVD